MKDFDYRYRAQVAFVIGILTGWFAFVQPYRSWLTTNDYTDLTIRYAGNFLPPLLGGFIVLLLWLGLQKMVTEPKKIWLYEYRFMGVCAGLICGNLLLSPFIDGYIPALLFGAVLGGIWGVFVSLFEQKYRRRLGIFLLMVTLGSITGWLLLDYQVGRWLRGNFKVTDISGYDPLGVLGNIPGQLYEALMLGEDGKRLFNYSERKTLLTWLPTYTGMGLFVLLFPVALYVDHYARKLSIRAYGLVFTMVGIGYWFLPMGMTGIVNQSFLSYPPVLRNQFRIACLFTHKSSSWPTTHYEVQFEEDGAWTEGELDPFFPIDIFGHRTRFNRIVLASKRKSKKTKKITGKNKVRLQEMGMYIRSRWQEFYPDSPKPIRIRYTVVNHPVNPQYFTKPEQRDAIRKTHCMAMGEWSRPLLSEINDKHKRDLGIFELEE